MDYPFSFESNKFVYSFKRLFQLHKLVGDALDIVAILEVIRKLLKLVSSDLLLAYNTGMGAEDSISIDLFLFSDKLVEHELAFNSVFREEAKVAGSLTQEVDKNPSLLEWKSVIELELDVEWKRFAFRNVLLEDSKDMCTTG